MTYFFETYGCEMNIAESASVEQLLISRGWTQAPNLQVADLVIMNTCSVRGSAEQRILGRLGFFTGLKKVRLSDPHSKKRSEEMRLAAEYVEKNGVKPMTLIVMGCMAERLLSNFKKDWPVIDYVVGTFGKSQIGRIIETIENQGKPFIVEETPVYTFADNSYEENAFSTFVPIMNGCNNFCTYCIVPYVRGREISRPVDMILKELDFLSSKNVKEITLLGQNVNSYHDADGTDFPHLLTKICRHLEKTNSSIEWIRFESSHPKDMSDDLIKVIAGEEKVCKGLHVAVQHGSSKILKQMTRVYTREKYLSLVERIKANIKDVTLTTDIMIGFPGETEEDFNEVLTLMKQVEYESAFMYYFNPREGTPAARFDNQISLEIKKERLQKVIDLQLSLTNKVMSGRVGRKVKVLADIVSRDNKSELLGKTSNNERVAFEADPGLIGTFVEVSIDSLNGNTFRGRLIQ